MSEQLSPTGRFERILLASDGSENAAGGERVALAMAEQLAAQLCIVSVVVTNAVAETEVPDTVREAEEEASALQQRLRAAAVERAWRPRASCGAAGSRTSRSSRPPTSTAAT